MIIGVDLGGTRIRAARLDDDLKLLERRETLTLSEQGPDAVIERICEQIQAVWPATGDVQGIGVSSPGPLEPATGVIVSATNLPGWHNVPLGQRLEDRFGVPVYVGNDANVAALAEVARGAARGCKHVIYVTLSTGLGGGIIVDGRLLLGRNGFAAEVGSMMVIEDGQATTWELVAGGPPIAQKARERLIEDETSIMREMVGGDLSKVDAKLVGQAAAQGDALALEIVHRAGYIIGLGMTSLLHLFNPEILVIGGGLSQMGDLLFEPMRAAIHENIIYEGYLTDLRIELAALGEDVALIGGAALVRTQGGLVPLLE